LYHHSIQTDDFKLFHCLCNKAFVTQKVKFLQNRFPIHNVGSVKAIQNSSLLDTTHCSTHYSHFFTHEQVICSVCVKSFLLSVWFHNIIVSWLQTLEHTTTDFTLMYLTQ
jgi:hypothetical protein